MALHPKLIYRFKAISFRIPAGFFAEINKLIPKIYMKWQGSKIAKTILKKNKVGELNTSDFKNYYKVIVIKTVWYWHKDREIDQWNTTQSLKLNPYIMVS